MRAGARLRRAIAVAHEMAHCGGESSEKAAHRACDHH